MKKFVLFFLCFFPFVVFSQMADDFSDGDFTYDPEWIGDPEKFIVNNEFQLQLNAPKDGSPAQLLLPSSRSLNTSWEFWLKMSFNPTSANYSKIYLCSNSPDLTGDLDGLFVRVGYTKKQVSLVSQTGKTQKILIAGEEMRLNRDEVSLKIRVIISKNGELSLYSKLDDETDFILEGSCLLEQVPQSNYFGIVCVYSATRKDLFYYDDFQIKALSDDDGRNETSIESIDIRPDLISGSFQIDYNFDSPENHCRLMIFDRIGRLIGFPYNNQQIGSQGTLFWNGRDESGQGLKRGIYIIYMEVYDNGGKVLKFKKPVIIK